MDPKKIVAEGYNAIAERYCRETDVMRVEERDRYSRLILDTLPAGARVLEIGCGAGIPTTKRLAEQFAVTGVDISPRQIELARQNVPAATFVCGDMTALDYPVAAFDGVIAFYSITHVPRAQHADLLKWIASVLRPGGFFFAAMGAAASEDYEEDWLGAPMYFSHWDAATNRRLVEQAGLSVVSAQLETAEEDGVPVTFLWIVAQKPS